MDISSFLQIVVQSIVHVRYVTMLKEVVYFFSTLPMLANECGPSCQLRDVYAHCTSPFTYISHFFLMRKYNDETQDETHVHCIVLPALGGLFAISRREFKHYTSTNTSVVWTAMDRLPTKKRIIFWVASSVINTWCLFCNHDEETREYLFFGYAYTKHLWIWILQLHGLRRHVMDWMSEFQRA